MTVGTLVEVRGKETSLRTRLCYWATYILVTCGPCTAIYIRHVKRKIM